MKQDHQRATRACSIHYFATEFFGNSLEFFSKLLVLVTGFAREEKGVDFDFATEDFLGGLDDQETIDHICQSQWLTSGVKSITKGSWLDWMNSRIEPSSIVDVNSLRPSSN